MSEVTDENAEDCSAAEPNEDQSFATKERETYNRKSGTNDEGADYEILLVAYTSITLALQKDIQNFKISTNNEAYGKFDDVVAEILRNGIWNTFAMQLKWSQNKTKNIPIHEYFEAGSLPEHSTCILFTNSSFNQNKLKMANLLNISDCDLSNSELLHYFVTNQQSEEEKTNILKKIKHTEKEGEFYFFTKQQNCTKIKISIEELFEKHFHLNFPASTKIAESFLKFISAWKNKVFGSCKLDKEDIKAKVFQLEFWDHIYNFNFEPQPNLEVQNFQLLKGVCNLSDITIIKTVKHESLLSNLINSDFKSYQEDQDIRKKRKSCLLIPENRPTISKRQLYYIMWKAGQIPLILNTTEVKKETLYATLKFASIHRVILFGSNVDVADLQGFKSFQNLSDLKIIDSKTYYKVAKQFKLSLQGRETITLEQFLTYLGGQETGASIVVEHLLLMATGCILVGGKDNFDNLPQHYVPRQISRNVVNAKEMSRIKNCTVLIDCKGNKIDEIQKQIGGITTDNYVSVDDYLRGKGENFSIILADQSSTQEQWDKVIQRENDAIHLKAIDHTKFEIIVHDSNSTNKLKKYTTVDLVREDKIFDEFKNKLNVVCAEPGMGKSTFTVYLARTCPSHIWVKRIECKEHNKFFGNECNLEQAKKHFSQNNQDALEKLCENRMKLLYIFDGLDEIDFQNVDNAIKCMNVMSDAGIKIWVSARHNLQERLEKGLGLLSMDIQEFSEGIQKTYIHDRLKDTYSNDEIDVVLDRVFKNTCVIQNKEILGVPLQLYMLTQTLIDDRQLFRDMSEKTFVLTRMYHNFFEGKFKMKVTELSIKTLHEEYEQQAIISTLSSHIAELLHINVKNKSQRCLRDKHYQSLGIIVNVQNSIPIFAHHTYAEYFTACWLVDNFQYIAEENRRFLFEEKYQNLRILFDMKLSEELPLHLAVLYKDVDGVKKNIDQINQRDSFGRTALHITRCSGIKLMNVSSSAHTYLPIYIFGTILEAYETRNINSSVKEIMKCLVQASNESTLEEDKLFRFTSMQYADSDLSLRLLEELSAKYPSKIDFNQLHSFSDLSTVLCYAASIGYTSLMKIAVHSVDNSSLESILKETFLSDDETLLSLAAFGGNIDSVKLLIDKGANINQVGYSGISPLMYASKNGNYEICKMLIGGGADINQVDKYGTSPLMYASKNGNSEISKMLIGGGADINQVDEDGKSPLMYASENGNYEICKMLIGGKADINQVDEDGRSPLMYASKNVNYEICKMLIGGGADINQVDKYGTSPLMYASKNGNSEISKMLIGGGADINQVDEDGKSPLMYASENGNYEICKMLIGGGADINQVDEDGRSPLMYASENVNSEISKMLIDGGADINQVDKVGTSPLIYATMNGRSEICKMLIGGGADINQVDKVGTSPLIYATMNGRSEICKMLIGGGADINQVDKVGRSPLMYASKNGNYEICKMLIGGGADINQVDKVGTSPLIYTSMNGRSEICKMLIDGGADINQVDKVGTSPLIYASMNGRSEICKMLIGGGADINQVDEDGKSPLMYASKNGNYEICKMLIGGGADINQVDKYGTSPLMYASKNGNSEISKMLIGGGADINQVDEDGKSPLMYASENGNYEICKMLIGGKADINQVDEDGRSPLMYASKNVNYEICKMLIGGGADINQVDKYGTSPLMYASKNGNYEICKMLIGGGADINQVNKHGTSPLMYASENGNYEICKMLIGGGADINQVDKVGTSPLIYASMNGRSEICKMLIGGGADINQVDKVGKSPLMYASKNGNYEICKMLIGGGADINQVDKVGTSPLIYASMNGRSEICKMLIGGGADINQVNKHGTSPLMYASENGNYEICKMLIGGGADINQVDKVGKSSLMYASRNGNSEICKMLIGGGADINQVDKVGTSPLIYATMNGRSEICKMLIGGGADINQVNKHGTSPLIYASMNGRSEICKMLIDGGADINQVDEHGNSPLMYASKNGNSEIYKMLIDGGADINQVDEDGSSLMYASENINSTSFQNLPYNNY